MNIWKLPMELNDEWFKLNKMSFDTPPSEYTFSN